MVSYIKTQWFRLLIAIICLVICCVYAFKPAPDTSTLEGLELSTNYAFNAGMYLLSCIIWLFSSVLEYLIDCVKLLEKKQERDDAMYELVQELVKANGIDREVMKKYEDRLKKLEDKR